MENYKGIEQGRHPLTAWTVRPGCPGRETEMDKQALCAAIERISEQQVIQRLGYHPVTWYTGGSQHNDYRLSAEVGEDGRIKVSDTSAASEYLDHASLDSDEREIADYVSAWLDCAMAL